MRRLVLFSFLTACGGTPVVPPPALELVGLLHDPHALRRPHDVEIVGDAAYVPGKGGSFALIDIADPTAPRLLSALAGAEGLDDAETVLPLGGGIVLLGTNDLHAVDVSDPLQPRIVHTISDRPRIERINGMARLGGTAFAACKSGFIAAFDVSDPRRPVYRGAFDARDHGQTAPHDVAALGEERIVVVSTARRAPAALRVYKPVSDGKLLPLDRWSVEGEVPAESGGNQWDLGGANRVAVRGDLAFVGAFLPDRLGVVDLRDPLRPRQAGNIPVCDIDATGLEVVGDIAFVAGGECIEAVDVSDPARLRSLAQYRGGALFPERVVELGGEQRYDDAHDLVYRDGYLYVTAQNGDRFGVLRVNDPRIRELAGR